MLTSLRRFTSVAVYRAAHRASHIAAYRMSATVAGSKRNMVQIGTHSGTFHCDEALGCWMLKKTNKYKDASIVRSRDPETLKTMDVVIDVGGVYDPETERFDHHQREFKEVFGYGFNTKLSSAGLVYKHFGKEVIGNILGKSADDPDVSTIFLQVYRAFIEAVDAVDNGINPWDSKDPPKYVNNTHLGARVGQLNPSWNEPSTESILYDRFLEAVQLTGSEFEACVKYVANSWLPGRQYVLEALQQRHDVHASGHIIRLNTYCPWKEHLYQLEQELGIEGAVLFCLYEDDREKKWRIQAVSKAPGSFENRRSIGQEAWRGLRDEELSSKCGIPGCVFIHASGFIGGNATYEGALEMAKQSVL